MKAAIPTWEDRISPVFDVARDILVVGVEDGTEVGRREAVIEETALAARAKRVVDLGANALICGAISQPLEQMLVSGGVSVVPHCCGPVEDVLRAFMSGELAKKTFLMPGCRGQCRRFRHRRRGGRERFRTQGDIL